ncbi:MAG: hypothetical protein ACOYJG_04360 [Prevotella sp.]|jgi:hypothetical protein
MLNQDELNELWQLQDAVVTIVEANGYSVWNLRPTSYGLYLELSMHLDEEAANHLSFQFNLSAEYWGEGENGSVFRLYF